MSKPQNEGNHSNSQEIPYEPLPEITPPGILPQPDSQQSSYGNQKQLARDDESGCGCPEFLDYPDGITEEDVERMRKWGEQNKL